MAKAHKTEKNSRARDGFFEKTDSRTAKKAKLIEESLQSQPLDSAQEKQPNRP